MNHPDKDKALIACQTKRRYPDEVTALASGAYASTQTGDVDLYVYRCPLCLGWHLTRKRDKMEGGVNRWIFNFGQAPEQGAGS